MKIQWIGAAVAVTAIAGCSSEPPEYQPPPGALTAGTAQVTINGQDTGTTETVQCTSTGSLTTIDTGDPASGVTAMVSNAEELTAESVSINNVGGFTGSYNAGLGGNAKVVMIGRTYDITGTADGFDTAKPSFRAAGTFAIKVSC
ncbi:MAG TPA: lipoprotein LpqH [Mycobacterium sp.]|nr:lipoprotein LpqH [Mycobacterium sp.]